jgi:uncharacterized protein (DUF302 family)
LAKARGATAGLRMAYAAPPHPPAQGVSMIASRLLAGIVLVASTPLEGDAPMAPEAKNGVVSKRSAHSVDETLKRIEDLLHEKNVNVVAVVDHSGAAAKAGLQMPPTKLIIFGNAKGGTPLMLAAPTVAIDLPLKILVWEDGRKNVWVSYNALDYLRERHGVPPELMANVAVVEAVAAKAAQ